MITRDLIVQEARTWIGTRFHHQGRIKKSESTLGGCGCLGLIIGVAREFNIPSGIMNNEVELPLYKFDCINYSKKPMGNDLHKKLLKLMIIKKKLEIGDVLLFKIQNRLQHLAIYSYNDLIVHCLLETRKVVERKLDDFWTSRVYQIFSFNGISQ